MIRYEVKLRKARFLDKFKGNSPLTEDIALFGHIMLPPDEIKDCRRDGCRQKDHHTLLKLLLSVIAKLMPSLAALRFGKEMLKEVRFCYHEPVKSDNIEQLDTHPDD